LREQLTHEPPLRTSLRKVREEACQAITRFFQHNVIPLSVAEREESIHHLLYKHIGMNGRKQDA